MKNYSKYLVFTTAAVGMAISLASCGGNSGGSTPVGKFDFNITLASGHTGTIYLGQPESLLISEVNPTSTAREYTVSCSTADEEYITIAQDPTDELVYTITPKKVTEDGKKVSVKVKEKSVKGQKTISFEIDQELIPQDAGINYSGDAEARGEILGKLEEYAMKSNLTGITLFEQGSYVRYSSRVKIPATEYITGYGWGILAEGSLEGTLPGQDVEYPTYLQTASSSDPLTINAWDATGSQVSDLNSYISTSYWGTRMKGTNSYEWYPILAKDTVHGKANTRPIPLDKDGKEISLDLTKPEDQQKTFKKWRIYVKTYDDDTRMVYRTNSSTMSSFNNRPIKLEDYEFVYQMLLSEQSDLTRGTELAGDTSYGIKGAQAFYRRSKDKTSAAALDTIWKDMQTSGQLGLTTGTNSEGGYLDIEILSPVNSFYAMYNLSSNLYSPMPRDFLTALSGNTDDYCTGAHNYGTFANQKNTVDTTLSVGPFFLEKWTKNQQIVFKRNDTWFEVSATRYKIPGVCSTVITEATQRDDAIYDHFEAGQLDSTNIPQSRMDEKLPTDKKNIGDSTFKLNVNTCDQDTWNSLFGKNGTVSTGPDNAYLVKPWMSNSNFVSGLYWSINRKAFAEARGVTPSINYFADAYMSDGENGTSYNSTQAHKDAIASFHDVVGGDDNYGFDLTRARAYFNLAVNELVSQGKLTRGSAANPTVIQFNIEWMYQSDINDYGDEIVKYLEDAFNGGNAVADGTVKLDVTQHAVAQWDQVYTDHLMCGKYDLGFGAISGNTLNPLNFLEVLKSDNSSGFTLNWGNDTSVIDDKNPIVYDGKAWSFDALWAAADHGAVVKNGENVNPIDHAYMTAQEGASNALYEGGAGAQIQIPFDFVNIESGVTLTVDSVQIYLLLGGNVDVDYQIIDNPDKSVGGKLIVFDISEAQGSAWNTELVEANELQKKADKVTDESEKFSILHPFRRDTYNEYWNVEIHYSLLITGDTYSTESVYYVSRSKIEDEALKKGLVIAK